ncbi:MAG: hypothetical protein ACUVQG_11825 [Thermogutta sp.]
MQSTGHVPDGNVTTPRGDPLDQFPLSGMCALAYGLCQRGVESAHRHGGAAHG